MRRSITEGAGLSLTLIAFLTLKTSLDCGKEVCHTYNIVNDTTYYFHPDEEYLDATFNQPNRRVQNAVRKGKTMYMIVGIKVAHKANVTHAVDNSGGFDGDLSVPIDSTGNQVGGNAEFKKEAHMTDEKKDIEHDFVYAYRRRKCVRRRGEGYSFVGGYVKAAHGLYSADSTSPASPDVKRIPHDDSC